MKNKRSKKLPGFEDIEIGKTKKKHENPYRTLLNATHDSALLVDRMERLLPSILLELTDSAKEVMRL